MVNIFYHQNASSIYTIGYQYSVLLVYHSRLYNNPIISCYHKGLTHTYNFININKHQLTYNLDLQIIIHYYSMFNPESTIFLEFSGCLNPNNFDIIQNKNLDVYLAQLKQFGKPTEQLQTNDDLLRALGLRILKNTFLFRKQQINIYLFISERFPAEIPQVYISEEIKKNWKYKYHFQNQEEIKKDGKYNLAMIISKIQNQITRNGIKIEFSEDLKNLKDTFSVDTLINALGKIDVAALTSSKNPSQHEISQQFRMSKQFLAIIQYFNQLSMLNDRIISDIRIKQGEIELHQNKLLEISYDLEKSKSDFAEVFCNVEGIKSRFSKYSIVQWLEDKIKELSLRVEEIEKRPFSSQNFMEYKSLMKELKKLELRKEKIV